MKYKYTIRFEGEFSTEVEASTTEEAEEKGLAAFEALSVNELFNCFDEKMTDFEVEEIG